MALSVQPLAPENYTQIQGGTNFYGPQSGAVSGGGDTGGYVDTGGSGYYGGGGGGGGSTVDPTTLAQYDQSIGTIQNAINRTGSQLQSGYSQIDADLNNALNQLLLNENQGRSEYNTNKQNTATEYVGSKNTIRSNAGGSLNSLLRLLGARGAGGGSAARIAAPGAVARRATLQQNEVGSTFGNNNRSLDTNFNNFLTKVENERATARTQRDNSRAALEREIANNKGTLLGQLAQLQATRAKAAGGNPVASSAAALAQAQALFNQTANYTVSPIAYHTQAYTAPELSKYVVNPNAAPTFNGQASGSDYVSPYLAALLGKKEQSTGALA